MPLRYDRLATLVCLRRRGKRHGNRQHGKPYSQFLVLHRPPYNKGAMAVSHDAPGTDWITSYAVPPESSSAITGESTAITRATTNARQAESKTTWPKIRSTLATSTPKTPWTTARARRHYHSFDFKNCSIYSVLSAND